MKSDDNEDFRQYLIEGNGGPWIGEIAEQIKRLRFYIETLEKFISDQETREITVLKTYAEKLSKEAQGEFWNCHYPVHWDDIFRTTLRSSALLSVMSFAETNVTHICNDVELIARTPIRMRDLDRRDGVWKSAKLFLEAFGKFTEPGPDIWKAINGVYAMRNLFAHKDGRPQENEEKRFEMTAQSVPGLIEKYGQYEIGAELIPYVLDTMSSFFQSLVGQLHGLCARVKSFEKDSH